MKRKLTWILGVVALIATAFALSQFPLHESQTLVSRHHQHGVRTLHPKSACQIFTAVSAKAIVGSQVRTIDTPPAGQTSTEDVRVSSCAYETAEAAASLTVRAALHRNAYATNVIGFQSTRTAAVEQNLDTHTDISSQYRVAAYYNPTFKQLNVLLHHGQYWLIIQADRGRATTEQLAQVFLNQLLYSR
jgi:hypothetical protein